MAEKSVKPRPLAVLIITLAVSMLTAVIFTVLYNGTGYEIFKMLAVTFFVIFYHFVMRVLTGVFVTLIYRRREFDYDSALLREKPFEKKLYAWLHVRRWKNSVITAKPSQFDVSMRTYDELLHNITQAEIVHEIIMILSFVPLFLIPAFGAPAVFILTSVAACLADLQFVIIQRYNRPRVRRIIAREQRKRETVNIDT